MGGSVDRIENVIESFIPMGCYAMGGLFVYGDENWIIFYASKIQ